MADDADVFYNELVGQEGNYTAPQDLEGNGGWSGKNLENQCLKLAIYIQSTLCSLHGPGKFDLALCMEGTLEIKTEVV